MSIEIDRPAESHLKDLLVPFFSELDRQGLPYCVCGNYEELPERTSHDVDIWAEDTDRVEGVLFRVAKEAGFTRYLYHKTSNGSNNFFYITQGDSFEFTRIDLLKECAWRSFIPIVKADQIKKRRLRYKNFYIVAPQVEACMHLLYPLATNGRVKDKYRDKIYSFRDDAEFQALLAESLGRTAAKDILCRIRRTDWDGIEKDASSYRTALFRRMACGDNVERLSYAYQFLKTNFGRVLQPAGLFAVFIGPDGCGKTTIVNQLSASLSRALLPGKIKRFYWRPFLLPRLRRLVPFASEPADRESPSPRSRKLNLSPKSKAVYLIKYLYYSADFMLGRLKYQAAWSRGGGVFFDRYYYDHMVYPQRFGFVVPKGVMRFLKNFVPEPDLVFYLWAPSASLLDRKMELPLEEVTRQTQEYHRLADELPNFHVVDSSSPLHETERRIIKACLDRMAERLDKGR
jgi:thymidylate kinase